MKLFKHTPPEILPLSRQSYIKGIAVFTLIQIILVAVYLWFLNSPYIQSENGTYFLFALIGCSGVVSSLYFKRCNFAARFKDIYPGYEISPKFVMVLVFFPILLLPFMVFLSLKEKSDTPPLKIMYRVPYLIMLVVPLAWVQFQSAQIAYWTANPSVYYIQSLGESLEAIDTPKDQVFDSYVDHYFKTKKTKLTETEMVLLTAKAAQNIMKLKGREPAGDKKDIKVGLKYAFLMISELNKVLIKSEELSHEFSDYSLVQWLSPSGQMEIMLLGSVRHLISKSSEAALSKTTNDIVSTCEKQINKIPLDQRKQFEVEMARLKDQFYKTRAFRKFASTEKI